MEAERIGLTVGMCLVLLVLYRAVDAVVRRKRSLSRELAESNLASQLLAVGHAFGVLLLLPGIAANCFAGTVVQSDILAALVFGSAGVVVVELVGTLGVKLLVRGSIEREVANGNVAAGIAGAANYVSVGILASRAIGGTDVRTLGVSLTFFVLAVVTLTVFVGAFRAITTYDDEEQVLGRNLAAAISYGGVSIAVAILVGRALEGDFIGWVPSLTGFAVVSVCALALYPMRQLVVQGLLLWQPPTLRGGAIDRAVGLERKAGVAVLEALAYIATAITISAVVSATE